MPSAKDVAPDLLIGRLKERLIKFKRIKPPPWASFAKTGSHRKEPPQQADWWYTRAASLLRAIYLSGPVGVERLRTKYGGRKDRGVRPEHTRKASGHPIRAILQQLEEVGLVENVDKRGRKITPKGRSLLDSIAAEILKQAKREPGVVELV